MSDPNFDLRRFVQRAIRLLERDIITWKQCWHELLEDFAYAGMVNGEESWPPAVAAFPDHPLVEFHEFVRTELESTGFRPSAAGHFAWGPNSEAELEAVKDRWQPLYEHLLAYLTSCVAQRRVR